MAPSKAEALIHKNYKTHRYLHHQEQKQVMCVRVLCVRACE